MLVKIIGEKMGIYGDDFATPIVNQDLASISMRPMPMPMMGFGCCTNLLGGVRLQDPLDNDRYQKMQEKEKKEMNLLKRAGIALLVMGSLAFVKFGAIGKYISGKCSQFGNWVKNLFKKTPKLVTPPTTPPPTTPPPTVP